MGASPPLDVNLQTDSKHGLFRILRGLQAILMVWGCNYTTPPAASVFLYVIYVDFRRRIASKVLGDINIPPYPAGTILRLNL